MKQIRGICFRSCLFAGLILASTAGLAQADFLGYYAFQNFTLTNGGGLDPNGFATSPDSNTVILTGTNDGSGLPGWTQLTIPGQGTNDVIGFEVYSVDDTGTPGVLTITNFFASGATFSFNYSFSTMDAAGFEQAGYVIDGAFTSLTMANNQSGTAGFTAPNFVPEPGTGGLLLSLAMLGAGGLALQRSKRPRRTSAFLAMGMAMASLAAPGFGQQTTHAGTKVTTLIMTGQVNLSQLASAPQGAQALLTVSPGLTKSTPPLTTPKMKRGLLGGQNLRPSTPSLNVASASGIFSFVGLTHAQQKHAYGGNQFSVEPPNPSIAAGNGLLLEGVNDAVQVYNSSGQPQLSTPLAANQVYKLPPAVTYNSQGIAQPEGYGPYLTDMHVYFDAGVSRWFIVTRSQDNDSAGNNQNSSHLYLAVSATDDPTQNYNIYVMDTTDINNLGCPCIDDYPQIGSDQYGIHISWNEYNTQTYGFIDAAILSISKNDLATGVVSPTAIQFLIPFNTFEFAILPATTPPGAANFVASGGLEYFVSSSAMFTSDNEFGLFAMYNTSSLATGLAPKPPVLVETGIGGPSFNSPVSANQPIPASNLATYLPLGVTQSVPSTWLPEYIDGGPDNRVQSVSYAGGKLYVTFPTELLDSNGAPVDGGGYMVLSPTFRSTLTYPNGLLNAQVLRQGYLYVTGNHLLRLALAVNAQGSGAFAATLVGRAGGYYPSAAVIPFQINSLPTTLEITTPGWGPDDGFTAYPIGNDDDIGRWGDTSTAVVSNDGSIWLAVEYIDNPATYPRTTYANWDTSIIQYHP